MEKVFTNVNCDLKPGLYVDDGEHLTAAGYTTWSKAMDPLLNEMIKSS
jgi:lysophospholipase L1-like esterase